MKRLMNPPPDVRLFEALGQRGPHQHLCSIYETPEERFAVAIPFIRIGLERGEKCIYIADDGAEAAVRQAMHAAGIDVEREIADQKLVLKKKEVAYLKSGSFDPEWVFDFWEAEAAEAIKQGFSALRATGETDWVAGGATGHDSWIEYESRLSHVVARNNCFVLCQYNAGRFSPGLVLDVIRTHPTVIYRGRVCRNLYYVPPDEFLGPDQPKHEARRLLETIFEREEVEFTLRQQRGQLVALSRRLIEAQEAERRAIARELHDDFGQVLTALRLNLQNNGADRAESIELLDQASGRIRDLVLDLRPAILDDLGLVPALRWYATREAERAGLELQLNVAELEARPAPAVEISCFRLVQEALTNVVRHGQARRLTLTLTAAPDGVRLTVCDDGRGFDLAQARREAAAGKSLGLIGMQERVSLAGGELEIETAPGRGTILRARFPRSIPIPGGA